MARGVVNQVEGKDVEGVGRDGRLAVSLGGVITLDGLQGLYEE